MGTMNDLIRFCEPAPTIPVHTSDTLPAALDDLKADIREYARR